MTFHKVLIYIGLAITMLPGIAAQDRDEYSDRGIPAMVTEAHVNARGHFGLSSEVLFTVNRGEYVRIIDQREETERIGDWESVWYKVNRPRGDEFWIYGAFVEPLEYPEIYSNELNDILFFFYIDEGRFRLRDGVYRCSEIYYETSYESPCNIENLENRNNVEIQVHNNVLAAYHDGFLQPLRNLSQLFLSPEYRMEVRDSEKYAHMYEVGRGYTGGEVCFILGIKNDGSIVLETTSNIFRTYIGSTETYTRDYQGVPRVSQNKPDYPIDYLLLRDDSPTVYPSPDRSSTPYIFELPHWSGEENFSNWDELSPIRNYEDFKTLSWDELPLITFLDRMEGNDSLDREKRWYLISYDGVTGYICLDPRELTSAEDYQYALDLKYFGP